MPSSAPEPMREPGDVTLLLRELSKGKLAARGELITRMYPDLKRLAEYRMSRERQDHTMQPTALVSELFVAMSGTQGVNWKDRAHFLAVASQIMKRYLIDYARTHKSERRGGGRRSVQFECVDLGANPVDAIEIGELLDKLAAEEPRMAQVVEMRCFGGLTHAEIGEALGIDERTSKRDWQVARAWLCAQFAKRTPRHDE